MVSPSADQTDSFSVLIADGDSESALTLAMYLGIATGFHVSVVHDGQSAIESALMNPPQVMICEVDLVGKNGFQVAEEVARSLSHKPLLIALTAHTEIDAQLFSAGYDRYFVKPAVPVEIETAIRLHQFQMSLIER